MDSTKPPPIDTCRTRAETFWYVPIVLLAFSILMFGDVLVGLRHGVLSDGGADLASEFYYWRDFGFSELRRGHIAQWNPYVYGGVPFFAGWQAGLFYPPNWIYLIFPLDRAINLDIFISTYLTGLFTSLLARKYGMHPAACLLAGTTLMFGGAFFPHIYAGHLATLASMAWAPLILLAVDSILDKPQLRSILLGGFALAMQILAGHPQTVYNTLLALALYTLIRFVRADDRPRIAVALAVMGGIALLLTAVQVLTGLQVNTEGTRSGAVPYSFATDFSFPPENLLTLVAPRLFGDLGHLAYWGRWYLWETNAFLGVTSVPLILLGFARGASPRRKLWATMAFALLFVALGKYTHVYRFFFDYVPGLNKFRSPAKFVFEACIFLALLAGAGLDALIRRSAASANPLDPRWLATLVRTSAATAIAGLVCAAASVVAVSPIGLRAIVYVIALNEGLDNPNSADVIEFIHRAQTFASLDLSVSAAIFFLIGGAIWGTQRSRVWTWLIVTCACIEMFAFARATVTTFQPSQTRPAMMTAFYKSFPGDYRIAQNPIPSNRTMAYRMFDIWGYDPMVLRRYAEFVIGSEGGDIDSATMYASLRHPSVPLRLLRLKYVFTWIGDKISLSEVDNPLPHGLIVYRYRRFTGRDHILPVVLDPQFDALHETVLERKPSIAPVSPPPSAPPGQVRVAWRDSDTLDVQVDTPTSGIVVITDTYSRFFHATALPGSAQKTYTPMPANYMEIGVPVVAGRHHFLLNYLPPAFLAGAVISALSLIGFGLLCWREMRRSAFDSSKKPADAGAC
ncbi:MAG: hypothetical protein P4L33_11130 [Capsulimonadaceae bacterium]|nr:hypothetical protein [Capsulimonadaceae bacterium]